MTISELCDQIAREADAVAEHLGEASRYLLSASERLERIATGRVGHCVDSRCENGWTVRLAEDDSLELVRCELHG